MNIWSRNAITELIHIEAASAGSRKLKCNYIQGHLNRKATMKLVQQTQEQWGTATEANNIGLVSFSATCFSGGAEDTKRAFSECLRMGFFSTTFSCRRSDRFRLSRLRSVVLGRRNWTNGLVLGLWVGLCPTPHGVANSLNFCNAAISSLSLSLSLSVILRSIKRVLKWV